MDIYTRIGVLIFYPSSSQNISFTTCDLIRMTSVTSTDRTVMHSRKAKCQLILYYQKCMQTLCVPYSATYSTIQTHCVLVRVLLL